MQDDSTPAKVGYEADESARGEAELGGRVGEAGEVELVWEIRRSECVAGDGKVGESMRVGQVADGGGHRQYLTGGRKSNSIIHSVLADDWQVLLY